MKKLLNKLSIILIVSIFIITLGTTITRADDTTFDITESDVTIALGKTEYLSYENKPSGSSITWSSSDEQVATVEEDGKITAVGIGTTTITATVDDQTATCKVTVVYYDIQIGANSGNYATEVNLIIGEHESENLKATVRDWEATEVSGANVEWASSDTSIVTVDNSGKIEAKKEGTATITATAAGVSDTCEVNVYSVPEFTDFSNAKYELMFDTDVDLKITSITPDNEYGYYYIITSNNTKPTISTYTSGFFDLATTGAMSLVSNTEENYIYARNLDKYVELNQDLYLWVIEEVKLDATYYNDDGKNISYSVKYVVEGEKLTRPELPQLNLILKSFTIGEWSSDDNEMYTNISFRFPTATENRKFKIKIGKVTDNSILNKIQNNNYEGITELLSYAKKNNAIYTDTLTTTSENYFRSDDTLFDGNKLLKHKEFYYIYIEFDDEDGKYYPIEGVTLGQAWLSEYSDSWDLWAYTSEKIEWNNLSATSSTTEKKDDTTASTKELPYTGITSVLVITMAIVAGGVVFFKRKNDKYKGM